MKVTEQYDSNMKGKNDQSTIQRLSQVFIHSTINIYMITIWKKKIFSFQITVLLKFSQTARLHY